MTPHEEERAAWLALVNATMLRADAACERDPVTAMKSAVKAKDEAITTLRRLGVDVEQIKDPHGLWPKAKW